MAIRVEHDDGVVELILARPEKRNALSTAMYDALSNALDASAHDPAVRAVLIHGEGGHFTAGNDIADFMAGPEGAVAAMRFIRTIAAFQKPVVAAVEGNAIGIGTTMLLHCDLAYAAPGARFATPFVDLGLVPEAASSLLLPMRMGAQRAAAMLLLGEAIDAETAVASGLCAALVPAEAIVDHARTIARRLAAKPPLALADSRRLMRGDADAILARIDQEAAAFAIALDREESQAAFAAFFARGR